MTAANRDDVGLTSLVCPHCKMVIPVPLVQAFEKQQLLYLKCENCGKGITKDQISEAWRDYTPRRED